MADIREWRKNNMPMFNDDNTELLLFHPKSADSVDLLQGVTVGSSSIPPSKTAKNLCVIFDTTISLNKHIAGMSRAAYYHLRATGRINPVSRGQCHLNHLTILRRFSLPSLAYKCTKVA